MRRRPLFQLGRLVATPGALELLERLRIEPLELVVRHVSGDYGTISKHDRQDNDRAIAQEDRILSAYYLGERQEKLWIITEADRSVTTLLLPDEY